MIFSPSTDLAGGDEVTLEGTLLATASSVLIGGLDCPIISQNDTQIVCTAPGLPGGSYTPQVTTDTGYSSTNVIAEFALTLTSVDTPSGAGKFICDSASSQIN